MQFFNFFNKYRIPVTVGIIFIVGAAALLFKNLNTEEDIIVMLSKADEGMQINEPEALSSEIGDHLQFNDDETDNISEAQNEDEMIVVDVAGEVSNPSVYILPKGTRIYQAVEAAGGLSAKADTSNVNLAAVLHDGTKLYIPRKNESVPVIQTSSSPDAVSESGLININTANSSELQKLTGVGPATAEKILAYRREYGQFNKIEDLKNVSGIGEKTFAKLKSHICVQ